MFAIHGFVILIDRLCIHNLQQILDAYAKVTIVVKSWLVARDHSTLQHLFVHVPRTDAVRSLVYVECCADAVAGSVSIILPNFPEGFASEDVKNKSWRVFWKYHGIHTDIPLQHSSVQIPKLASSPIFSKVPRPRHICCPILVLPPRIDQYWRFVIQVLKQITVFGGTVVNDGAVGTHPRNGRKGHLLEPWLLRSESCQYLVDLHLTHGSFFYQDGVFKPRHEMSHGRAVNYVGVTHSLHLRCIFARLHGSYGILRVDKRRFGYNTAQRVVGTGIVQPHLVASVRAQVRCDVADYVLIRLHCHVSSFQMLCYLRRCHLLLVTV
mmetsp:Transcript_4443/g.7361  ORF Transcript_4443/g.7361 Transcript_4443/m.7361 type:complete len:323 (-) Transcript_4443:794-1762(-)